MFWSKINTCYCGGKVEGEDFQRCQKCNSIWGGVGLFTNPKKFKILEGGVNDAFTILKVKYEDCTNYEGVKILVYKGHVIKEIMAAKEIDPHFCDKHLSPIARFAPTEEGLKLALSLTCNTSILGIIE